MHIRLDATSLGNLIITNDGVVVGATETLGARWSDSWKVRETATVEGLCASFLDVVEHCDRSDTRCSVSRAAITLLRTKPQTSSVTTIVSRAA